MTNSFSRAGRRLVVLVAAAVATSTALVGSGLGSASQATAPSAPAPAAAADGAAEWTLMIYDVADTQGIAEIMMRNLAAFTKIPDTDRVNVVALVDLPEQDRPDYPVTTLPGVAPFTTAKLLVLDDQKWNEVRDLGEVSMGRPDVLANFIEEAAGEFPAQRYGLVLSDHGSGYAGGYYDDGPPGTSHLTIQQMRAGMISGMQAAGIDRFDMLDHDACLMANYETASALAPLAKAMVASEEITFGSETLTVRGLQALADGVSGTEWGTLQNEAYAEIADRDPGRGEFTAMSVVDGDEMAQLDAAVESFAAAATAHMDEIAPQVGRARAQALEFVTSVSPDSGPADIVDLGDFLRHLTDLPDDVAVARDAVFAALDDAVVAQVTRRATSQATGLNVFFPQDTGQAEPYLDNQVGPPGWSSFIEAYLEAVGDAQGEDGPASGFVSQQADIDYQGEDGIVVSGQLVDGASASVTSTETEVFTELDGRRVLAIDLPGYLDSGAVGQVQGSWSYQLTAIGNADPARALPVSSIYQAQAEGLIGTFFAEYQPPGGEPMTVQFKVLLNSDGTVDAVTASQAGSGGTAQVEIDGGTLTPYYVVEAGDGFDLAPGSRSIDVGPGFQVTFPQLPQGTAFDMGIVVGDVSGSYDGAFVSATVQGGGTAGQGLLAGVG